ncbi:hypothetical protein SAMN06265222_1011148 [Neorhodopirellula lusitana]|uniref:Uncharacterized protein n=1 Tax=Neorhodopirellula lusitana TaxID=445327 RepID=A0ABY1PVM0_9BACT|nr:hypothetical protein SAMN06265222_1011148 [Neorhodopirellula lusitana]
MLSEVAADTQSLQDVESVARRGKDYRHPRTGTFRSAHWEHQPFLGSHESMLAAEVAGSPSHDLDVRYHWKSQPLETRTTTFPQKSNRQNKNQESDTLL